MPGGYQPPEIEAIVLQQIKTLLADKPMLSGWMQEAGHAARIEAGLARAGEASRLLEMAAASPKETHALIRTVIGASTLPTTISASRSTGARSQTGWQALHCIPMHAVPIFTSSI